MRVLASFFYGKAAKLPSKAAFQAQRAICLIIGLNEAH
jgi:hypothetical protein